MEYTGAKDSSHHGEAGSVGCQAAARSVLRTHDIDCPQCHQRVASIPRCEYDMAACCTPYHRQLCPKLSAVLYLRKKLDCPGNNTPGQLPRGDTLLPALPSGERRACSVESICLSTDLEQHVLNGATLRVRRWWGFGEKRFHVPGCCSTFTATVCNGLSVLCVLSLFRVTVDG